MTPSEIEVRPLTSTDEGTVRELFRSQGMTFAGLTLNYDRGPEFKRLLSLQAPRFQTYVAKQGSNVRSLISLASGPRWCKGEIREIAFLSDFRIDRSPEARQIWRDLLEQVVGKFQNELGGHRPSFLFALVLKGNKPALRSFTSSPRTTQFQMREVGSVRMINIFARPRRTRTIDDDQIRSCTSADQHELKAFLKSKEAARELGYVFDENPFCETKLRMENWNFRWEDFLILRLNGQIEACCLPWAPDPATKVMTFSEAPRVLETALNFLNRFGFKVPRRGEPIRTLYLTHLQLNGTLEPDVVISRFLDFISAAKLNRGYQMISFADWWSLGSRSRTLKLTLRQSVDVGIYSIAVAGHELFEPSPDRFFNFEMAVI